MPLALPSHFELTVEVLASVRDLATIHIAGHPLGSNPPPEHVADRFSDPPSYAESWHRVRLMREGHELSLCIDGRKSPVILDPKATSDSLTFEPGPNRPTYFRDLIVEW
jgi:hypothetical protein